MAAPSWIIRIGQRRREAATWRSGLLESAPSKPLHTAVAQGRRMASVGHQGIHQKCPRRGVISVQEHSDLRSAEFSKRVRAQVSLGNQLAKGHGLGRGIMSSAKPLNRRRNLVGIDRRLGLPHRHNQNYEACDSNADCACGNDRQSLIGCEPAKHSNNTIILSTMRDPVHGRFP